MTGGNFSLSGGFWPLISVVQAPGAPKLTITCSGTDVIVSWPSPTTGFILQQNNNVNNAIGWATFGGTINDNGTTKSVTIVHLRGICISGYSSRPTRVRSFRTFPHFVLRHLL